MSVRNSLIIGFIFLVIMGLIISCNKEEDKPIMLSEASYSCPQNAISNAQYQTDRVITYNVKVYKINGASFSKVRTASVLNAKQYFGGSNIQFDFYSVEELDIDVDVMSYRKYLREYYEQGHITLLIVPDNMLFEENVHDGSFTHGVANGVPKPENVSAGKPTIVIRETAALNGIMGHEMGHVFGLPHTFANNDMRNKGLNCDTGDKVVDTVTPHPESGIYNESCELYLPKHLEGFYTDEEAENIVGNSMNYSPYNCMIGFSKDQHQKIRKMASINPRLQDCEKKS